MNGVNLMGASLKGADLRGASLTGARLMDALFSDETRFPSGFDPRAAGMRKYARRGAVYTQD
jgi:uncharacterized protein YjbI with pentapeptide repeats